MAKFFQVFLVGIVAAGIYALSLGHLNTIVLAVNPHCLLDTERFDTVSDGVSTVYYRLEKDGDTDGCKVVGSASFSDPNLEITTVQGTEISVEPASDGTNYKVTDGVWTVDTDFLDYPFMDGVVGVLVVMAGIIFFLGTVVLFIRLALG